MSDIHKIVVTGSGPARIVAKGASTGRGVPAGGSSGQVLSKSSATDYDTAWTSDAGGDALVANPLSQFAATTSAQLAGVISDETGSGKLVFATSPSFITPVIGVATGTSLAVSDDAYAAGWNGDLTVPTKNAVYDKIEDIISIYTEKHATSHTIEAAECYGGVHYCPAAATITLPAVADGMSVSFQTVGAVAVSVKPNASDLIYLDGVALDDGDKITNTSTAGDIAVLTYYDATGWHAATNGWTDGGA